MDNDPFNEKLNLTPYENTVKSLLTDAHNDSAIKDFEKSRANILVTLTKIDESIDDLMEVAKQSQHPRAYEVLAKLIDTKVNANRQLLELQSKIREIDEANKSTSDNMIGDTINNNLFVTTAEMLEYLKVTNTKEKKTENDGEDN